MPTPPASCIVVVNYDANTEIRDPTELQDAMAQSLCRHLRDVSEAAKTQIRIWIRVTDVEIQANFGQISLELSGSVDGRSFHRIIRRFDRPSTSMMREADKLAAVNLITFLYRWIFPSVEGRAFGSSHLNGRILRAYEDAMADVRRCIDCELGRPVSSGHADWNAAKWGALAIACVSLLITLPIAYARRNVAGDPFNLGTGSFFLSITLPVTWLALSVLRLPERYLMSEKSGRDLVTLIGVKSYFAIRSVAVGAVILSSAIALIGAFLLLIQ